MTFAPVETGRTLMTAELIASRSIISFRRAARADSLISFAYGLWSQTRQQGFDIPSVLFRHLGDRDRALNWRVLTISALRKRLTFDGRTLSRCTTISPTARFRGRSESLVSRAAAKKWFATGNGRKGPIARLLRAPPVN